MKLFLVLSVVFVGAFAADRKEEVMECAKKFNVAGDRIPDILSSGPKTNDEECLIDCAMKKIGVADEEGKLKTELAKKELEDKEGVPEQYKEEALKRLDKCAKVECSGGCTCAVATMMCLTENLDPKASADLFG